MNLKWPTWLFFPLAVLGFVLGSVTPGTTLQNIGILGCVASLVAYAGIIFWRRISEHDTAERPRDAGYSETVRGSGLADEGFWTLQTFRTSFEWKHFLAIYLLNIALCTWAFWQRRSTSLIILSAILPAGFLVALLQSLHLRKDFGTCGNIYRHLNPLKYWARICMLAVIYVVTSLIPFFPNQRFSG